MGQRGTQHRAAAQGGSQAGHHLHGHVRIVFCQFQQRAGHAVDSRVAAAHQRHGPAAVGSFQRPAAAIQFFGHAGGVVFFFRVIRAHQIQIDRIAAQHLGFFQGALRLCGQKLRVAGAKPDHIYDISHSATSSPGHRGTAPAQGSHRRPPVSGCGCSRRTPAQRPAHTRCPPR